MIPAEVMTPLYKKWLDSLKDPHDTLESIKANIPLDHRMTTTEEITNIHITSPHVAMRQPLKPSQLFWDPRLLSPKPQLFRCLRRSWKSVQNFVNDRMELLL